MPDVNTLIDFLGDRRPPVADTRQHRVHLQNFALDWEERCPNLFGPDPRLNETWNQLTVYIQDCILCRPGDIDWTAVAEAEAYVNKLRLQLSWADDRCEPFQIEVFLQMWNKARKELVEEHKSVEEQSTDFASFSLGNPADPSRHDGALTGPDFLTFATMITCETRDRYAYYVGSTDNIPNGEASVGEGSTDRGTITEMKRRAEELRSLLTEREVSDASLLPEPSVLVFNHETEMA